MHFPQGGKFFLFSYYVYCALMCVSGFALSTFLIVFPVYLNEFVNNSERALVSAVYTLGFATGKKADYWGELC